MKVNNCEFYYEDVGSGPPLVFVHGESHGIEYFEYQFSEFSKKYRCFTYYRRGHGRTQMTSYGYSLENQTRDLAFLLHALNIQRPVIIGVAFGNTIGANFAINYPDQVRALVMESWLEILGPDYPSGINLWPTRTPKITEVYLEGGREALVQFLIREGKQVFQIFPSDPKIVEKFARMFANRPPEAYDKMNEFGSSVPNLIKRFREVKVPVLGICGAKDPYPDNPDLLKDMANFKEIFVPKSERFVHWENPAEFNRILEDFLSSVV
ncbi:MAG TPA: alpha/beta hydrolase [Nitrososphaerales archaeon]|nr:alpha/beta hydrolase [Nitrososphaerales archaeon]